MQLTVVIFINEHWQWKYAHTSCIRQETATLNITKINLINFVREAPIIVQCNDC